MRVSAAVMMKDGRVLVSRRKRGSYMGGWWEFPGGKCRIGESFPDCLKRELREELGVRPVRPRVLLVLKRPDIHITFFVCSLDGQKPRAREGQAFAWTALDRLGSLKLLPLDRVVLPRIPGGPGPVRLVILDLDGTLVDSRRDIAASVNFARRGLGLTALSQVAVDRAIGEPTREMMRLCLDRHCRRDLDRAVAVFDRHYLQHDLDTTRPFPGVLRTLARLRGRGYRLAVASNKWEHQVRRIVRTLGLSRYLGPVVGSEGRVRLRSKPDPDMLRWIMRRTGERQCIMVGDGRHDILAGKNAGAVLTIGATYGIGDPAGKAPADLLIGEFRELEEILI